jgi:GNAT superfamily N-acetyltransferase
MKPERVVLHDGREAVIRSIRPDDAGLLRLGFESLSSQSRTARFLAPKAALSDAEVAYFTDVNHVDHEALVAADAAETRGFGVARYIRDSQDPTRAEFAVVVVDDLQGGGLAPILLDRLARRARAAGITHFDAHVLPENRRMLDLARQMWQVEREKTVRGLTQISLRIAPRRRSLLPPFRRATLS